MRWLLIIALPCFAQPIPSALPPLPAGSDTQISILARDLPQYFTAAGAAYTDYSSPHVAGWLSYAMRISERAGLYSITTQDWTSSRRKPSGYRIQSSMRTGLATLLRKFGPVSILGYGDAGMAGSDSSLGAAFSGGGIGVVQLGKTNWCIVLAVRQLKTTVATGESPDTQTIVELGFGRAW